METTLATSRRAFLQNETPPLSPARPRQGFTLVEMIVAISIILVLVALVLPTAFSLVENARTKQTKATMNVLRGAIEAFHKDNPFVNSQPVLREMTVPKVPGPGTVVVQHRLRNIFDRFPPSPTAMFSTDPENPDVFKANGLVTIDGVPYPSPPYPATKEHDEEPAVGNNSRAITETKFVRLINVMKDQDLIPNMYRLWLIEHDTAQPVEQYASIECLVFALREFSPSARSMVDKLEPAGAMANLDKDFAYHDTLPLSGPNNAYDGEKPYSLYEVLD
ncbi:MAG TPA: type II secretion system protein, partial [Phycisphaerae bacterium]|nr:type II secretion system protein [Phycisphaerae bacterium]